MQQMFIKKKFYSRLVIVLQFALTQKIPDVVRDHTFVILSLVVFLKRANILVQSFALLLWVVSPIFFEIKMSV